MAKPTLIQHPLINRPGSSQRRRVADALALNTGFAPIDGRTMADLLDFIYKYARQVNFYEFQRKEEGEYLKNSDWQSFFEQSIPIILARFSNVSLEQLETGFAALEANLEAQPNEINLQLLVDFIFYEVFAPLYQLQRQFAPLELSFNTVLERLIKSSVAVPLLDFIQLTNTSVKFFCVKTPFTSHYQLEESPWNTAPNQEAFHPEEIITQIPGGRNGAILWLKEECRTVFSNFLSAIRSIATEAPLYLEESIEIQHEKHEPHIGLLLAFLTLFKYFQGDINQLTQKHLDFFYKNVLRIKPKDLVPDKAHLIFEVANHLDKYVLKKDILFKDGKDQKNADVLFRLEDEIVIDKAQVGELKTLFLNPIEGKLGSNALIKRYVEGVYIAPIANSADGKGEPFKEEQSKNWNTLGSKGSKYIAPSKTTPENHPYGRIGFVLASPVLLLNEGKREITITLDCSDGGNRDIFTECFNRYQNVLNKPFYKISDSTIKKIEALFSPEAKAFLQKKLEDQSPYLIGKQAEFDEFLKYEFPNQKRFTDAEKELLRCFIEKEKEDYVLKEMPFAAIIPYFITLLTQQNPFCVGFEIDDFLETQDPISCDPIFKKCIHETIKELLDKETQMSRLFNIQLSGADGWVDPQNVTIALDPPNLSSSGSTVKFVIIITMEPDEPAVTFFDPEKLKEKLPLECPLPVVKIEVNNDIKIICDNQSQQGDDCCLKKSPSPQEAQLSIALYHFFRHLKLIPQTTQIKVKVCGVKNVVVQNNESLQDVNSLILPFGTRPKLGAEFFIGSKEIFCKNWKDIWVNVIWKDKPTNFQDHYKFYTYEVFEDGKSIITYASFKIKASILEDGSWKIWRNSATNPLPQDPDRKILFSKELGELEVPNIDPPDNPASFCAANNEIDNTYHFKRNEFSQSMYEVKKIDDIPLSSLNVNTRNAFLRLTLDGVSFQHERYAFELARQMFLLSGGLDPVSKAAIKEGIDDTLDILKDKIRPKLTGNNGVIRKLNDLVEKIETDVIPLIYYDDPDQINLNPDEDGIRQLVNALKTRLEAIRVDVIDDIEIPSSSNVTDSIDILEKIENRLIALSIATEIQLDGTINTDIKNIKLDLKDILRILSNPDDITTEDDESGITQLVTNAINTLGSVNTVIATQLGLPKEPYTPTIKAIFLDYEACAVLDASQKHDIDLIHLYPFENTSKAEEIELSPTLFPTFTDEGTLFIGLKNIRPGAVMNLLFQLAEATADSERNRAKIAWHYLTGNRWLPLRKGFEILADETNGLTVSGIVKLILPGDIADRGNTVMPSGLYWIKVAAAENVLAVAEAIGVHTQAARVVYHPTPTNDTTRLQTALPAGRIAKLFDADFSVKKVTQPYDSFGGKLAEAEGALYTRVSEHLRHKGRGIALSDFEHLLLEAFPEIFKAKCISHTLGLSARDYQRDLELAPGFITIAVIPDLTKLKPGNMLEPKAPVSLLEAIYGFFKKRISPFARLKIVNPRYESVDVDIEVRLQKGRDENYYANQLKEDLLHFLAPWYLGDSEKITFGQIIRQSDVIKFVENLDYIDFIAWILLKDEKGNELTTVHPRTARSILTGGAICIKISREQCEDKKPANTGFKAPGTGNGPIRFSDLKRIIRK